MSKRMGKEDVPKNEKNKKNLSIPEASKYTSLSLPYLYKLTSTNGITHYKIGSRVLFLMEKLDKFILDKRVSISYEIDGMVLEYSVKNPK